ncbi:MAG: OB-fold nucleic acid binding domain-containing protein, partial [Parahaliea sp.]
YARFRDTRPWTGSERLGREKEALGLFFSGHPIDEYEREVRKFAPTRIADARGDRKGSQLLTGLIVSMRTIKTKRGDTMVALQLDDRSARIEVSAYGEVYAQYRELLVKDNIVIVEGTIAHDDYSGALSMRAKTVRSLAQARESFASALTIELHSDMIDERLTDWLAGTLSKAGGGRCPVWLLYRQEHNRARVRCGERWQVVPSEELLQVLRERMGNEKVVLEYA